MRLDKRSTPGSLLVVAASVAAVGLFAGTSYAGTASLSEMFPINYPTTLHGVFFHDGVMYATGIANLLVKIDPVTGLVLEATSPLLPTHHAGHLHGATLGPDGTFYVVEAHSNTIYRLRLDDYSVVSSVSSPPGEPYSLAYRDGVLWIGPHGYSTPDGLPVETIYGIDPDSGEVLHEIRYAQIDAHGLVWVGDYLWVLDNISDSIHQVDPNLGAPVDTIRLPGDEWYGMAHDGARFCGDNPSTFFVLDLTLDVCPPPGEVVEARFPDKSTLTWDEPSQLGGGAVVYDVLRSSAPENFTTPVICVESDDGNDSSAAVDGIPANGEVFHYLIRAENPCPGGVGSLGMGQGNSARVGGSCE